MNIEFAVEIFQSIGVAIIIGAAFLVIPFALLILGQMLPWYITKMPFVRRILFKESKNGFNNDLKNYRKIYIDECHPSQVIKHLKCDGLQSLFINYSCAKTPVHKPDTFSDKNAPSEFLNSANPIPIKDEFNNSFHTDNLPRGDNHVNQNRTIPAKGKG